MQEIRKSVSNEKRSRETRAVLLSCARKLFVERGYAETGTPEIVRVAGLTRGALYHHFKDKEDLFKALLEEEASAVAKKIIQEAESSGSAMNNLLSGSDAYFRAMSVSGRARLLLIEGPAVLGIEVMSKIDEQTGKLELERGLAELTQLPLEGVELAALATILSAAFDRAALAISIGESALQYRTAIKCLLQGLVNR